MKGGINKSSAAYKATNKQARKKAKDLEKRLFAEMQKIENVTKDELEEIANNLKETSVNLAPKDTGVLRASAYVKDNSSGHRLRFNVGYTADHALYQHENYEEYQNPTTPGTEPNFLLGPFNQIVGDVVDRIKNRIRSRK